MKNLFRLTVIALLLFSLSLTACSKEEQLDTKSLVEELHSILSGEEPREVKLEISSEGTTVVLEQTTDGKSGTTSITVSPKNQSSVSCPDIVKQHEGRTYVNVSSLSLLLQTTNEAGMDDSFTDGFEGMYIDVGTLGNGENMKKLSKTFTDYLTKAHIELLADDNKSYTTEDVEAIFKGATEELTKNKDAIGGAINEIRDFILGDELGIDLGDEVGEDEMTILMSDGFGITIADMLLKAIEEDSEMSETSEEIEGETGEGDVGEDKANVTITETLSGSKGDVTDTLVVKDKDGEVAKITISVKKISKDSFKAGSYKPKDIEIVDIKTFIENIIEAIENVGAGGEVDDFPYSTEFTADTLTLTQDNNLYEEKRVYTVGSNGVRREDVEFYTKELYMHEALLHQMEIEGYNLVVNNSEELEAGEAMGFIKVYREEGFGYGKVGTPEELLDAMLGEL